MTDSVITLIITAATIIVFAWWFVGHSLSKRARERNLAKYGNADDYETVFVRRYNSFESGVTAKRIKNENGKSTIYFPQGNGSIRKGSIGTMPNSEVRSSDYATENS